MYVYGLSNPFDYYQENIGFLLMQNGEEFDFENYDAVDLVSYRDLEDNFSFKYDRSLKSESKEYSNGVGKAIVFYENNQNQEKCIVEIMKKGCGIGSRRLPRERDVLEKGYLDDGDEVVYFESKNGQIVHISENWREDGSGFAGATFIKSI